jgi:hypothetical protein
VEVLAGLGKVGPIAEDPGPAGNLLLGLGKAVAVFDPEQQKIMAEKRLPAAVTAVVPDATGGVAYLVLEDGSLWSCRFDKKQQLRAERLVPFGQVSKGCFLLPRSRRLVGVAADGMVTVFEPSKGTVTRVQGPVPPAAGPAVHPTEDVWFFAHRRVLRYALK